MCRGRFTILSVLLVVSSTGAAEGQWISLIDGHLAQWTQSNGESPGAGWYVDGGTVYLDRDRGRGGNIVTDQEFGEFELSFEFRISERGNSGIKYRVQDFGGRTLGCEYQIIDDDAFPNLRQTQASASLYDVYAPDNSKRSLPAGQWNRGVIRVHDNTIEHWLNGYLVIQTHVGSATWQTHIAESKFSGVEGFGENHYGKIMLTDHNSSVAFRNMFIRSLEQEIQSQCPTVRVWRPSRFLWRRRCR